MLNIEYTRQFKRDLKLAKRQGKPLKKLEGVMRKVVEELALSNSLKDHALTENWRGHRGLHVMPDWLLVYKLDPKEKLVIFTRLGSHSELFR